MRIYQLMKEADNPEIFEIVGLGTEEYDGNWIVQVHPTKTKRYMGQVDKNEGVYRGEYEDTVR